MPRIRLLPADGAQRGLPSRHEDPKLPFLFFDPLQRVCLWLGRDGLGQDGLRTVRGRCSVIKLKGFGSRMKCR